MGSQPAGLLSWSGASTFRALVTFSLALERYGGGTANHANHTRARAKRIGWEPRAGLLSWSGASTFRALVMRNTNLAVVPFRNAIGLTMPQVIAFRNAIGLTMPHARGDVQKAW